MPRHLIAKALRIGGFMVAYGAWLASAAVVAYQAYRWLREGQWTPIGVSDGLRSAFAAIGAGEHGRLAQFAHWLADPTDWIGWHRALELTPASVALFLLAILGNFAYVYGSDSLKEHREEEP